MPKAFSTFTTYDDEPIPYLIKKYVCSDGVDFFRYSTPFVLGIELS